MKHIKKLHFASNQYSRIILQVCHAMVDNNNKNSTVNHNGKRVIHGDQGTPICDACCKGDKCNSKDCFDLKQSKIILLFYNIIKVKNNLKVYNCLKQFVRNNSSNQ